MSSQRRTRRSIRSTADDDAALPSAARSNSTRNRSRHGTEAEEVDDDADFRSAVGITASSSGARVLTDLQIGRQLSSMQSGAECEVESESDHDNEEYGDLHRMVLQAIMSAGYLDAKSVKKLFRLAGRFLELEVPEDNAVYPFIQKVVREINDEVKEYDMAIKSATCEITGEKYYVFLVTMDKPIMKFQKYFSKVEIELFKKILSPLLCDHVDFAMSRIECLNITHEMGSRAMSKDKAEDFIDKLIYMKYFVKIYKEADMHKEEIERDYDITLGFRAIRELEQTLQDVYGSIFGNCCLCKSILLNGLKCPNAECDAVIHRGCVKKFLKNCNSCVLCKEDWKIEDGLPVRTRGSIVVEVDPSSPSTVDSSSSSSDDGTNGGCEEVGNSTPEEVPEPAHPSSSSRSRKAAPKSRKHETPKKKKEAQATTPATPTRSSARRRTKKVVTDI